MACVADQSNGQLAQNYEMANYTVMDGTHLQMTLNKVHRAGATIAIGGSVRVWAGADGRYGERQFARCFR